MPNRSAPLEEGSLLAAIDLGSNSFHLVVCRLQHGELRTVEALGERVQLGAGLVDEKLADDAIERGLECLSRFKQLLSTVEPKRIRVVGTNALRQAKNRAKFIKPAEEILGVPVNVIYGREEARLVYLGVAHTLADDSNARLVIDIGGGSTEFIIGQRFEPQRLESLQLGCVSFAQEFFPDGGLNKGQFKAAYEQALVEVSHIRKRFHAKHWQECVGSSGTLQAVETLIVESGFRESGICRDSLDKLQKKLIKFDHADQIDLPGLNEKRRYVIAAGVAVTCAIFDCLGITEMRTSKGALREGVVYDLMGRLNHEDVRERSVVSLMSRYDVDTEVANHVAEVVNSLCREVEHAWLLEDEDIDLLQWTAKCHEVGYAISSKGFHRHSAYIIENSDMPGFSQQEQETIALLARWQKGKVAPEVFADISEQRAAKLKKLIALLRVAMVLKYADTDSALKDAEISAIGDDLTLKFDAAWREAHPLTMWELESNKSALKKMGIQLITE